MMATATPTLAGFLTALAVILLMFSPDPTTRLLMKV
jgi:hypothetical protein